MNYKRPSVQSDNLLRIVVVVYGVALTQTLVRYPDLMLRPLRPANIIPSISLLTVALLASYAYFAYVMAVSQDHPYDVLWTMSDSKWPSSLRFGLDLLLAILYVRLLFVAASIPAGSSSPRSFSPSLHSLLLSVGIVMAVAAIVRWIRYKELWRALPCLAVGVGSAGAGYAWGTKQSRNTDLVLVFVLLTLVVVYIIANEVVGYIFWKEDVKANRLPAKPPTELSERLAAASKALDEAIRSPELKDSPMLRNGLSAIARSLSPEPNRAAPSH